MPLHLRGTSTLLFIGDSITDCGRKTCAEKLGHGYVRLIRDWLAARDPANCPRVINVGTSGNKIDDLQKRWHADVIEHRPDVVSIKIGINDVWHGLVTDRQGTSVEDFRIGLRDVLGQLKQALPGCELVVCEPSVIDPPQDVRGNEQLPVYVQVTHEMADEFGASCVVPLHQAFINARNARPDLQWTTDGVHPTELGHALIARTWLSQVGLL